MAKSSGSKSSGYKFEFFDREYTAREAYSRVWHYAKRYKLRLFAGVICGMLTAGTLLPLYNIIQPVLAKVETVQASATEAAENGAQNPASEKSAVSNPSEAPTLAATETKTKDKTGVKASEKKLSKNFAKFSALCEKFGYKLQDENEALGLPLLLAVILIVPFFAVARCALVFINQYCLAWAAMKTVRDIKCEILAHVQKQSMQFFGRIDVGQVMSRATGDPQQIQTIVQQVVQEIAQAPFEIAVSIGFIIYTAIQNNMLPTLGIIIIGFPMFMCPVVFLSKVIRKWSRKAMERYSQVGSRIHEILTCIKAVKAYHTEDFENKKYSDTNNDALKATMRSVRWGMLVGPAVEGVGILLIGIFIVWCFFMKVKISAIIPMLAPLLIIYKPLKQLSKLQVQLEQGRAALARVWSLMDVDMALPEKPDAAPHVAFNDKVVFNDVSFRYDTAETDAVSHASFEIKRGKVVAVVGGTGSGKSTMSALLARFFDPAGGSITLDGTDIKDMRIADLRNLIGSVQQETLLFNDTIESNIKYGSPDATHEQVIAAAKMANAHEFIMSQPGGYSRMAGEKGFALSGGERQRIAIARAILKNPPILILDEATSALDTVTERLVQDAINNLMKDRTTFAIAHRLSTIRDADTILVMDHGKIVERGTHEELYALGGMYRKLCDMQKS